MFSRRKNRFNILQNYIQISCDSCSVEIEDADVTPSSQGVFYNLADKSCFLFCAKCFDGNLESIKREQLPFSTRRGECVLCGEKTDKYHKFEANNWVRHLCHECLKSKTHPDNSHGFHHSKEDWGTCSCGAIRYTINSTFRYRLINEREEFASIPRCNGSSGLDRHNCEHEFIDIVDFKKGRPSISIDDVIHSQKESDRTAKSLGAPFRPLITEESLALSRKLFVIEWCIKCGRTNRRIG